MGRARFVLGVDNGLLHFAGTTGVPIIFGHTVADVEHRRTRRKQGITHDIVVDKAALPCIGCQSKMRFIQGHRFTNCLYDDRACLDFLFSGESRAWKQAIDQVLGIN